MIDTILGEKNETIWAWLFPITYLVHVAEEYCAGIALAPSSNKIRGANLTATQFLMLHGIASLLLLAGFILAGRFKLRHWMLICLGTIVLVNGIFHAIGGLRIGGYNPGLISGALIWIPLGLLTLVKLKKRMRPDRYWLAFAIGIGINVVILLLGRGGRRIFEG
jgi:hypothetical protein